MKIVHYSDNADSSKNKKHVVNFFGIFGCIKVVVPENSNGEVVNHYFDYPGFSEVVNPELFQKELNDRKVKASCTILALWLCAVTAFYIALYCAHYNRRPIKVLTSLASIAITFGIIATILFTIGVVLLFFEYFKEKFVEHRIQNLYSEEAFSSEWIERFKNGLLAGSKVDAEMSSEGIDDLMQFFLEREKVLALFSFLTGGEELVQAGMAMVNKLLMDGIHPNNIILDTNSLGGGIAAEVLKRFEGKGIYLTFIHSNSYRSLKAATKGFPHGVGDFFMRWIPNIFLYSWFKCCGLEFNAQKIIETTQCPVLIVARKGDKVIQEPAQLAGKIPDKDGKDGLIRNLWVEHDKKTPCGNSENIHVDYEDHLVEVVGNISQDKSYKGESYIKIKEDFIKKADNYLQENELNTKYSLEEYMELLKKEKEITMVKVTEISPLFKPEVVTCIPCSP